MTNKLVVVINSLKVPKIKRILLYEMKFLVPNYSCLQNPWLDGYRPQIHVLWPQMYLLNPLPNPGTKLLVTPLIVVTFLSSVVVLPSNGNFCAVTLLHSKSDVCKQTKPNGVKIWNKIKFLLIVGGTCVQSNVNLFGAGIIFFLILAHPVYKMWIIQEPNTLELWNKLHFEEKKNGDYIPCLNFWCRNNFFNFSTSCI